ncbi:hypothetical protein [Flavobacterium xylosi]
MTNLRKIKVDIARIDPNAKQFSVLFYMSKASRIIIERNWLKILEIV